MLVFMSLCVSPFALLSLMIWFGINTTWLCLGKNPGLGWNRHFSTQTKLLIAAKWEFFLGEVRVTGTDKCSHITYIWAYWSKQTVLLKYNFINLLRISSKAAHGRSCQQCDAHCPLLGNKCTSVFNYPCLSSPAAVEWFDVSLKSHWSNLITNWQCGKTKTRSNCPLSLPCASSL